VTQTPSLVEFKFGDLGEQVPGRLVRDVGLLGQGLSVHDALLVEQEEHVVARPAQPALVQVLATCCNTCAWCRGSVIYTHISKNAQINKRVYLRSTQRPSTRTAISFRDWATSSSLFWALRSSSRLMNGAV
jgi:hypothetical protein